MAKTWHDAAGRAARARRILVLGSSGAGKSVLSRELSRLLGLDTIHLDAHFWQSGFKPSDQAEWRIRVKDLVAGDAWVMDGTYESTLDVRLAAAELVIYVEESRARCLLRAAKRMTWLRRPQADFPLGHRFDPGLFRYIWQFSDATHPRVFDIIRRQRREADVVTLSGRRQSDAFLRALDSVRESAELSHKEATIS